MTTISICAFIILAFSTSAFHVTALEIIIGGGGIIIGGGGASTSPSPSEPPEECPSPPPPLQLHAPTTSPPSLQPPPPPPPSTPKSPPSPSRPRPTPTPKSPPSPSPSRPPPTPPLPPPSDPYMNPRLQRDLITIRAFQKQIQKNPKLNDPKNITSTWVTKSPCFFKGFNCSRNPSYGHRYTLSDVQFNGFHFSGVQLNGFIDKLTDVSIFHANSNNFCGQVPPITSITHPYLFELDLSNNQLTGVFPKQVLSATNLTFLDIRFNNFAGKVDPSVFFLDVDVLFINNNNFFQGLPKALGSTPALYLTLANNKFIGSIPDTIGKARKTLLEVLFLGNKLSGCLPWQIGLLKLARVFDASDNMIHGPIPSSFACLNNIKILNLKNNNLNGVVPEMLCAVHGLQNLTLESNYFTEVGPNCRKLIDKKVLHINGNCIRDLNNQRNPKECTDFFKLPWSPCPNQYLHAPCKAAKYGNGGDGHNGRRVAEVGPVLSATYGALNP